MRPLAVLVVAMAVLGRHAVGALPIRGGLSDVELDASEFFQGSQSHPKLEIETPENNEVLETNEVDIRLRVAGYSFPSHLHDARVCLGLASDGERVMESCFRQADDATSFHASNLVPGKAYMLRVVLFERSHALAVSVRSFKVGGVSLAPSAVSSGGDHGGDGVIAAPPTASSTSKSIATAQGGSGDEQPLQAAGPVTIRTALQVAMAEQSTGKPELAEHIYRQILRQHPSHADALHLLGLVMYQKGDPESAIQYIERALLTNSSFENFHNSLGECLRASGRLDDAVSHFSLALSLQPDFLAAKFNLGLTFQERNDRDRAMSLYHDVVGATAAASTARLAELGISSSTALEAHIRYCDLMTAQEELVRAQGCWESGIRRWPSSDVMHNELANVLVTLGDLDLALEYYENAVRLGMPLTAELNIAIVLELEGKAAESAKRYEHVLEAARAAGMPYRHVMIKMATMLPRVIPSEEELLRLRHRFSSKLDALLVSGKDFSSDISEPLHHGFSTGLYLAFHGVPNKVLKTKLHRVYAQFCPALLNGAFVTEHHIMMQSQLTAAPVLDLEDDESEQDPDVEAELPAGPSTPTAPPPHDEVDSGNFVPRSSPTRPTATQPVDRRQGSVMARPGRSKWRVDQPAPRRIRVGFISRFLYKHVIGFMVHGLVQQLDRTKFQVLVFRIDPDRVDQVSQQIDASADEVLALPTSLNLCADIVRSQRLDVLVYPEVGLEPLAYFLAFARLAPVQVAWWGHPETTGIPTIDYFVSSSIETPAADAHYSEKLIRLSGLGVYASRPVALSDLDPAVIRDQIRTSLNLPRHFHFYLCPQALFKFHPRFDDVLVDILAKDQLAYFLLVDGQDRHAWTKLLLARVRDKMKQDQSHRVLFYKVGEEQDMTSLYQASDVVLDTFPSGGFVTSLQALAVGAPVVTLPGELLSSRLTLAMYKKLELMDLVAKDPENYVGLALKVAHNAGFRRRLSSLILARNHRLFEDTEAVAEWERFLSTATVAVHARAALAHDARREFRQRTVT